MKNTRNIFAIILLLLLIFSTSNLIGKNLNPNSSQTIQINSILNQFNSLITKQSTKSSSNAMNNPSANTNSDIVIFANSKNQYNDLLKNSDITNTYPHLKAVRMYVNSSELTKLANKYPNQIQQSSLYQKMLINDPQTTNNLGNIQLNSIQDANLMNVEPLWNQGYNGTGVNVTVFDNGVNFNHPGLQGQNAIMPVNFTISDGINYPACATHGTGVAGTIASTGKLANGTIDPSYRGNAFGSKIIAVQMGCYAGEYLVGDFLGAFDWIIAHNSTIQVVNTSWGGVGTDWTPLAYALEQANITLVSSAGNSGPNNYTVGGPNTAVQAISVGATDYTPSVVYFSSRGPYNGLIYKPDVVAPGYQVTTTLYNGYNFTYGPESGTSFSSPLTAGAIATLISAMNQNSIPWNPGLIKAAIMRGATSINEPELTQGTGLVNLNNSWTLIKNAGRGPDNVPYLIEMTPKTGPYPMIMNTLQGVSYDIPFTVFTSHPNLFSVQITGNLSSIASFNPAQILANHYSQILQLHINTIGASSGTYTGTLNATVGTDFITSTYKIIVGQALKGKILMDLGHTTYDTYYGYDLIGGQRTGELIKQAVLLGYWVDTTTSELTSQLLSNYNVLWMPDILPLNLTDDFGPVLPNPLTSTEINNIVTFVNNGGSLFVNIEGYYSQLDPIAKTYSDGGTNATGVNSLLTNFGITTPTNIINQINFNTTYATVTNTTSLGKSVSQISNYGRYLDVTGNAQVLAKDTAGVTVAYFDQVSGGRVLVTDTPNWFQNTAFEFPVNAVQNVNFSKNVLNWLASPQKIKFLSTSTSGNTITGRYQVLNGNSPGAMNQVKLLNNSYTFAKTITAASQSSGIYQFSYTVAHDGIYNFQVSYGNSYIVFRITIDHTPPTITAKSGTTNSTIYAKNSKIFLTFIATDNLYKLTKSDFSFTLDGKVLTQGLTYSYNSINHELNIIIDPSAVPLTLHNYQLKITAIDNFGNSRSIVYIFSISTSTKISGSPTTSKKSDFQIFLTPLILIPLIRKYRKKYSRD